MTIILKIFKILKKCFNFINLWGTVFAIFSVAYLILAVLANKFATEIEDFGISMNLRWLLVFGGALYFALIQVVLVRRRIRKIGSEKQTKKIGFLIIQGETLRDACDKFDITEQTYFDWLEKYRCMTPELAVHLKDVKEDNARLRKIMADRGIDIDPPPMEDYKV